MVVARPLDDLAGEAGIDCVTFVRAGCGTSGDDLVCLAERREGFLDETGLLCARAVSGCFFRHPAAVDGDGVR